MFPIKTTCGFRVYLEASNVSEVASKIDFNIPGFSSNKMAFGLPT